ncbi:MAG: hypothetical protein V3R87_05440 [Dehalococcoidia bacterium]
MTRAKRDKPNEPKLKIVAVNFIPTPDAGQRLRRVFALLLAEREGSKTTDGKEEDEQN